MKKFKTFLKSLAIIILAIVIIGGVIIYKLFFPPRVKLNERKNVTSFVENYLIKKYGDHKYKVTNVEYEFDMDTLFDYSNPTGYWVDFTSDVVPDTWITINGLEPEEYEVDNDYLIEDYHFPDKDGYDVYQMKSKIEPKEEVETKILNELQKEFDTNINDVECDYLILSLPDNFGRIPTLEELENNIDLYTVGTFDFYVSQGIKDTDEYEKKLKEYIKNKYGVDSSIYFALNNTKVNVFLED